MKMLRDTFTFKTLFVMQVKGLPANQGLLYKQVLEDQFRNVGFNPEASFEETRYKFIV